MSSALPSRPRGFKVIVEGIHDSDPMYAVSVPTRWISQLLIDLGLGKIKVSQGITIYSRYSKGCPRKYFMSVVVSFESTINEDLRTAIESGNDIQLTHASKGDTLTDNNGVQHTIKKDKKLTIKQYNPYVEQVRQARQNAEKIRRSAYHEKKRAQNSLPSHTNTSNSFAGLEVD